MIDQNKLMAAQSKWVIAQFLGDYVMWQQAIQQMKDACGMPLYKKDSNGVNK
jgi:hypothetical protein